MSDFPGAQIHVTAREAFGARRTPLLSKVDSCASAGTRLKTAGFDLTTIAITT